MARDFYPPGFSISYIPFFHFTGSGEPEKLKAVLFYVHHDQWVENINEKLEAAKCRPMTADELRVLFRMQEGILAQAGFRYLLATDPSAASEKKGKNALSAIECREDESMAFIEALICNEIIPGHSGVYVAAVKKE